MSHHKWDRMGLGRIGNLRQGYAMSTFGAKNGTILPDYLSPSFMHPARKIHIGKVLTNLIL